MQIIQEVISCINALFRVLTKLKRCVDKFFPALVYQLKYQRISSVAPDAVFVEFQFHTCHITLSLFEFSAKIE